jgi:hypothetical protein
MKINFIRDLTFDEIYNFIVQSFFQLKSCQGSKIDILSISGYRKLRSGRYINFLSPKMTSNEKRLNYKIVYLVEKATSFI